MGDCVKCGRPSEEGSTFCKSCIEGYYGGAGLHVHGVRDGKNFKYRKSKPKGKAIDPDHHRNRTGKVIYTNIGYLPDHDEDDPTSARWGPRTDSPDSKSFILPPDKPSMPAPSTEGSASPAIERLSCGRCGGVTSPGDNYCRRCCHPLKVRSIFSSDDLLRSEGFEGFLPIWKIIRDYSRVPDVPGVYMVLHMGFARPDLLPKGSGGLFKDRDPNVSPVELKERWVVGSIVLYIGQAGGRRGPLPNTSTLRSRIEQYLRFGQGEPVGHFGGRYIWQIKDSPELVMCWKPLPYGAVDPRVLESKLLSSFREHYGKPPFANIIEG